MAKGYWLPLVLLAAAVGLLAQSSFNGRLVTAQATSVMAIDADPATPQVDAMSPPVAVGASTTVSVHIVSVGAPYGTYQWEVSFDPAQLDYVLGSGAHVHPDATICFGFTEGTFNSGPLTGDDFLNSACGVTGGGTTSTTGPVSQLAIACVYAGSHPLHLVTTGENAVSGTTIVGQTTNTSDATVVCQDGGGPAPTATATPVGGTTPAPTPSGPSATPTPLPPGMEAVPLATGCQFEAWTGADGTSPGDLAGLVGPAGSLRSLWAQQPAPSWKGYSPQFPDVSDMGLVNLLDVVAICMAGPGDFVRPVV